MITTHEHPIGNETETIRGIIVHAGAHTVFDQYSRMLGTMTILGAQYNIRILTIETNDTIELKVSQDTYERALSSMKENDEISITINFKIGQNDMPFIDWRKIFIKYAAHVMSTEGFSFGSMDGDFPYLTKDEIAEVKKITGTDLEEYMP